MNITPSRAAKVAHDLVMSTQIGARRGGAEVAAWTLDRKIRVRFPALKYTLTACGPSDGKEVKDVFGRPGAHAEVGSAR